MSDASNDITNQPTDERRTTDVTNDVPAAKDDLSLEPFVQPPVGKNKLWSCAVVVGLVLCVAMLGFGLLILGVQKVHEAAARAQSLNNCKQMCLSVNNIASCTTNGDIPPSYGPFPQGGPNQSFFMNLLPYIEATSLPPLTSTSNWPVKTYIAPADPNNPGTNALISYGSNATLLGVNQNAPPRLPASFYGRTFGTIVVFERTAKSGATWTSNNSYLIDQNGSSSPEFTGAAKWSGFGSKATALTSAGCIVGMGDGSARVVTQGNANAGWAWAMDPSLPGTQAPAGW